ncbi:hypothetical protein [Planotetraspora sp. GP83]|uniref:hypothetical protein n=1 Tax=Planotetraspora sp. GP83 TaxID=3156264 RepID=UPI0035110771
MSLRPTGEWFTHPPEGDVFEPLLDRVAAGGRSVARLARAGRDAWIARRAVAGLDREWRSRADITR